MCGIVYSYRKDGKATAKRVLKRYTRQADRGIDGFGYVAIDETLKVQEYRRFQDEAEVRNALNSSDSKHVLFHHRFPTSTINLPEAAHPIKVSHPELKHTYYVVHNGVISRPEDTKVYHDELGYKYQTLITTKYTAGKHVYTGEQVFNDSETLAVELARTIEGLQPAVRCTGSMAVMALQCDKTGTKVQALYYGTNGGNPLTLTEDEHGIVIASEGGKKIPSGVMYRTDFEQNTHEVVDVLLPYYTPYSYERADYNYGGTSGKYAGYGYDQKEEDDYEPSKGSRIDAGDWDEIAQLEEALSDAQADLAIARQTDELDEIESLEIEVQALQDELMEAYGYSKGSTIGF